MKKTTLSLLIALLILGSSLSHIGHAYADDTDYTFSANGGSASITAYTGVEKDITIPATLGGYPVTSLANPLVPDGNGVFDGKGITNVIFPDSITSIGRYAFRYGSLTTVNLPKNLKTLSSSSFEGNKLTSIVFPDGFMTVGSYAFYMNKLTKVHFPESITNIAGGSFSSNLLTSVVIPDSMTKIGTNAFEQNFLTSVTILGESTEMGDNIFSLNPGPLKIFGIAGSPAQSYASSNGHEFVDGKTLFRAMGKAKQLLTTRIPGAGAGQVPANALSDLRAALDNAKSFVNGITGATVSSDLTAPANAIGAAIQSFEALIVPAGNPATLSAALAIANQALIDHPQGTGVGQTSAADRSALQTSIGAAQQVFNQASNYRQDELDATTGILQAAIQTFQSTFIPAGNPAALGTALTDANQKLTAHPQGTGVGQTSASVRTTLQTAINTAQQVFNQAANNTQTQLDSAVSALRSAQQTFEAAIITAGNPAALGTALTDANQKLTDHPQGTGVGQASASVRTALQTAITTAQQVFNQAANNTQAQLDSAVSALRSAILTFEAAIITAGNPAALGTALTDANQKLTAHPQGTGVGQASVSVRTALQTAINTAQQVFNQAANNTQTQLDSAVSALRSAILTFEAAIITAGNPAALGTALTDANQKLTAHPQGTGVGQASASDRTVLQTAINAGQQVFTQAANYTQGQIDNEVGTLRAAIQAFEATIIPAGNPAALGTALIDANKKLAAHPQGTDVGQTSASDRTVLQTAISVGQQVFTQAANYTQDQLDNAVGTLRTAIQAFEATIIPAGNPVALGTALTDANQKLTAHPQGTDVGQTSASDRTVLQTAISVGQQVFTQAANYTQDQLDNAVGTLRTAIQAFEATIILAGDPATLGTALTDANQKLTAHPQGTDVGQASASDRTVLQTAISAAQQVFTQAADYTQGQLDNAVGTLRTAIQAFEATIILAGDPSDLEDSLDAAKQALTTHTEGKNVGQASAADRAHLQSAIDAAQDIFNDATLYTQEQLDEAVTKLETALDGFNTTIILAGDPSDLEDSLDAAKQALTTHTEGTNVGQASAAGRANLQVAIDAAKKIFDDAALYTQEQLNETVTKLETAIDTFKATLIPAGSATLLEAALSSAKQTMLAHPQGTGVGQTSRIAQTTLKAAIDAAQVIFDDANHYTQAQLDNAVTILEAALKSFEALIIKPSASSGDSPTTKNIILGDVSTAVRFTTEKNSDGQTLIRLSLTQEQLQQLLTSDKSKAQITINGLGEAVKVSMPTAPLLQKLKEQPNAELQVFVNGNGLSISLSEIGQLSKESILTFTITESAIVTGSALKEAIKGLGATSLIDNPIVYALDSDGRAIENLHGNKAQRTIKLPAAANPNQTTAVWIDANNKLHFVPSLVARDGTVTILSSLNGAFTVIQLDRKFSDIQGHWAKADIELLANKLIVDGRSEGQFSPNEKVTRAEFAALLVRALGLPEISQIKSFTDVKASDWYAGAVGTAQQSGLIGGFEDGAFRPNASITREQMASMIARALTISGKTLKVNNDNGLQAFSDSKSISSWAEEATAQLLETGIIQGVSDTRFDPKADASRAQSVVILKRMLQFLNFINT
ncbi:S-layer homology domain-containing protein [Cohnella abietis]|uniref:SLH domain-containing protein n=1 Tax=Cohnella abietis TaxID=2507935 RepID=A0A3T1D7J4_9BACL|nr:S-layer homology domain-containing protein [Cohnella abietis]BBI34025.1 hypothetical protein KCTCHS21_34240 [Cohnella abietis]